MSSLHCGERFYVIIGFFEPTYYSRCRCQGTGPRGCQGGLCEERLRLTHAGDSQFQLAQTDPPQDTAGPLSQDGGTSRSQLWENVFKKGQNTLCRNCGLRGEKCEEQPCSHHGEGRM